MKIIERAIEMACAWAFVAAVTYVGWPGLARLLSEAMGWERVLTWSVSWGHVIAWSIIGGGFFTALQGLWSAWQESD